jgi:hypothetical protein
MRTPTNPTRQIPSKCATPTRRRGLAATARHVAVDLTPQAVEQVAIRVAQLLRHDQPQTDTPTQTGWMTAKELATHLKLNPAWVYEHAEELGAIRTGNGPKARMRFDLYTATQALKQHSKEAEPAPAPRPRRPPRNPRPYQPDVPLLEIRRREMRGVRACLGLSARRGRMGTI